VTIGLPPHSSHLLQSLDVGCFGVLKHRYSQELEVFIKAYINHITKVEFFIAFQKAYTKTMTKENIKAGFCRAGLILYNPEAVLSKLDVKLCTPTPTQPPIVDSWTSQTPHNSTDVLAQTELVRTKITYHQRSSPTPIFEATTQLAKGTEILAYRLTLAEARISMLEKANEALGKRRRAKKSCIQQGGALSIQEAKDILSQSKKLKGRGSGSQAVRCCSKCKKPGHTARKCQIDVEMVDVQ
jgi:DDE superfamily endonuclease